jgi:GPH family glycoside/pentoside/hexuronide:cation symporter
MMLSFYPAIGTLMGVGFMMIYPLNEKMMEKISSELASWRGEKK